MTVIKDSFKIYFQDMEEPLPMEGALELLEQNVFHWPENPFPLAKMKDSFQKYVSTRREKNWHKSLVSA